MPSRFSKHKYVEKDHSDVKSESEPGEKNTPKGRATCFPRMGASLTRARRGIYIKKNNKKRKEFAVASHLGRRLLVVSK